MAEDEVLLSGEMARNRVLRHVVLFAFKPETAAEEIRQIEQAFADLPSRIEEILDFEWGTNVSIEGKAQGYTHCFLLTFGDEAGRAVYLPHPAHQAFGAKLRPHLAQVLVIDYWAER
jgi:hypothetical protein